MAQQAAAPAPAPAELLHGEQRATSIEMFEGESWNTYSKLVELNFMSQRELFGELAAVLRSTAAAGAPPLRVLDLGCGDARCTATALRLSGARVAAFTGVDINAPPLAAAARNLAFLEAQGAGVELVVEDISAYLVRCESGAFDLITSSFAVHHLSAEAKAQLLADAARCLRPGGAMLLIDTMLGEGESREGWLGRALQRIESCLNDEVSSEEERQRTWDHVSNHDYPESERVYRGMALGAGFAGLDCLRSDGLFAALHMRKE